MPPVPRTKRGARSPAGHNGALPMNHEYRALVSKVEAFTQAAAARRARDLACSEGCASCCHVWLTVSEIEAEPLQRALAALPSEERARIGERGRRELAREAAGEEPRCALLDDSDRCSVYEARPLVCRTQGHALRYPAGFVPLAAVRARTEGGDVTWCPLNYDERAPLREDILDAERVDQLLALIAQRAANARGGASGHRLALSILAADSDVLHEAEGGS